MRDYRVFVHRGARFRICGDRYGAMTREIVLQRRVLETYLRRHAAFHEALTPLPVLDGAPEVACRMARAAAPVGVGPMAAVAGVMAQLAAEAALRAGATEAIVDNGGDVYLVSDQPVIVRLYTGTPRLDERLAFRVAPADMPLAVCSSSGRMGHSMSLGECDLATVVAADAGLADAAATAAANRVRRVEDIDATLEAVTRMPGVRGVLLVKDEHVGLMGRLPELVKPGGAP